MININPVFNSKAVRAISSPDDLEKTVHVTSPRVWVLLLACVALLAGLFAWGIWGTINNVVSDTGVWMDGKVICFLTETQVKQIQGVNSADIDGNAAPDSTEADAWEAAETAGVADDIREMPMGMQTMITESGGGLSGGQKQRLMIARAICGKPKILILDEATSALDNITQKHVSDSLDRLKCTRIVVAHRLSTIKNCDRVICIDHSRVVEEGSYEELMKRNGFFAELVRLQQLDQE